MNYEYIWEIPIISILNGKAFHDEEKKKHHLVVGCCGNHFNTQDSCRYIAERGDGSGSSEDNPRAARYDRASKPRSRCHSSSGLRFPI